MAYDKEKDKQVWKEQIDLGLFIAEVGIYQYDGGEPKIQISRLKKDETGKPVYAKGGAGRMTVNDWNQVIPLIQTAMGKVQELKDGVQVTQENIE